MESSGDCEFMGHFKFSSPGAKKRRSGAGYVTPSGKNFSFDGGSEVMSRVRRGVLSLRVVRQMLS